MGATDLFGSDYVRKAKRQAKKPNKPEETEKLKDTRLSNNEACPPHRAQSFDVLSLH